MWMKLQKDICSLRKNAESKVDLKRGFNMNEFIMNGPLAVKRRVALSQ